MIGGYTHRSKDGLYWCVRLHIRRHSFELFHLDIPLRVHQGWRSFRDSGWREYEYPNGNLILHRTLGWRKTGLHIVYRVPPRSRTRTFCFGVA